MPSSGSTLCLDCSKRALPGTSYCDQHQTTNRASQQRKLYDKYRADDPIRLLYKTDRWQAVRRIVIKRDILCRMCGHRAGTECDHILSARLIVDNDGIDEFYNPDRIQLLCHQCHSKKTATEYGWVGKKGTRIESLPDRSNTTVVCGAPASGKSTYVAQHKAEHDVVWDYDVVMHELTGLPMHESLEGAIGSVLAERDKFIESTNNCQHHVWIIVSNPQSHIVKLLAAAGAQIVTLTVSDAEQAKRITERLQQRA